MGILGLFGFREKNGKQRAEEAAERRARTEEMEIYSGMRVEVTSADGRLFLVAKLVSLRGDRAQLELGADGSLMTRLDEPVEVTMRGYSSLENRAVSIEGSVRTGPNKLWLVEHLSLTEEQTENRANVRVETAIEGSFTLVGRPGVPEEHCHVKNIGMGGVCISSQARRDVGDKVLLQVEQILELRNTPLCCQILRIDDRRPGYFEYGCRFQNLDEETERRLFRAMYALYHGLY